MTQNAPLVAFGLGVKIPAAGPAHLRLYSHSGRLRARTSKVVCADLSAGIGRTPRQPRRARTPTAMPPRDHRTRPRSEQSAMTIGIPVQRNARATMPRGCLAASRSLLARPRAASASGRMRPRRDRARAADPWALRAAHLHCDRRATSPTAATAALAANELDQSAPPAAPRLLRRAKAEEFVVALALEHQQARPRVARRLLVPNRAVAN